MSSLFDNNIVKLALQLECKLHFTLSQISYVKHFLLIFTSEFFKVTTI